MSVLDFIRATARETVDGRYFLGNVGINATKDLWDAAEADERESAALKARIGELEAAIREAIAAEDDGICTADTDGTNGLVGECGGPVLPVDGDERSDDWACDVCGKKYGRQFTAFEKAWRILKAALEKKGGGK